LHDGKASQLFMQQQKNPEEVINYSN